MRVTQDAGCYFFLDFKFVKFIQVLVVLLHIFQVRHRVRKVRTMQVDVSSLFLLKI